MRKILFASVSALLLVMSGCGNFYVKTQEFNNNFETGNYPEALKSLEKNKKMRKENNRLLFYLNYATTSFFMNDYQTSIEYFMKADEYIDDYSKNIGYEALSYISNPMVKPYEPEYFERVLLHFYQALNFIYINNYESAMVECRRMNIELNKLSDKYKQHNGRRYSRDAFGHYVMGLLYETTGSYNDAFIAYRNAMEIYESDYQPMYQTNPPSYLKKALIRTANAVGFYEEASRYQTKYSLPAMSINRENGRLVVFVLDGLSPIKTENSLSFNKMGGLGVFTFVNEENDFSIPIPMSSFSPDEQTYLTDLQTIRATIPRYTNRQQPCTSSMKENIVINNTSYPLNIVEDIEQIASQSLHDRILLELGTSLLRAAVKESITYAVREKNEYLGLLMNISNAIIERADTRNWQSLPANIKLIDIELPKGEHVIKYNYCGRQQTIRATIDAGKTSFVTIRCL